MALCVCLQRAVGASPKNRFVWLSWGLLEAQQGRPGEARKLMGKGHQLNPRDPALLQVGGV